ncbi:MAG: hypothetical protein ACTSXK_08650 [Promethearchaeota archaeon]
MNLTKQLLNHYIQFCGNFSPLGRSSINTRYDKIIYEEFRLLNTQIKKSANLLGIVFLFFITILARIFKIKFSLFLICFVMGIYFYSKISNIFKDNITAIENKLVNYYQLLILQIDLLFSVLDDSVDRNTKLLEILQQSPKIACNLEEKLQEIYKGANFRDKLGEITFYSPVFETYFKNLLEFDFAMEFSQNFNNYNPHYENHIKTFIKSLETRLNLFFFISIFYPIGFILYFSTTRFNYMDLILGFLFFLLILLFFTRKMLNQTTCLIGESDFTSTRKKEVYDAFLNFFCHLNQFLIYSPPEIALIESILKLSDEEQKLLNIYEAKLSLNLLSLNEFLTQFFLKIKNEQIQIFLNFFISFFSINSLESSNFLSKSLILIKSHKEMSQEKEILLKSEFVKVKIYKILLGFVLGVLTPFLFKFQGIYQILSRNFAGNLSVVDYSIEYSQHNLVLYGVFTLSLLLLSMNSLNKIFPIKNRRIFDIIGIFIYGLFFFFSFALWGSLNFLNFPI